METATPAPAPENPPAIVRPPRNHSLVLIAGLGTTALTLLGVYLLSVFTDDFNIMGWYADYVLPVGALIVGVAASSGYGVASWCTGLKITRALLWTVLALQLVAYFAAQFIEFRSLHLVHRGTGRPVGFFEYFDRAARSFAWKQKDGSAGDPLGAWGYAFRLLEMAGFAAGGLIVPALLRKAPYCDPCQLYMSKRALGYIPASVPIKKINKRETEALAAHEAEQNAALEQGTTRLQSLTTAAAGGKVGELETALDELRARQKETLKLPRRISLHLVSCKACSGGRVEATLLVGQGNHIQQTPLGATAVPLDLVQIVRQRK